jgi:serine/threonine protein kinase
MRGELIGQGSYGKVFMALNASTGELMAVKQVEFPKEGHKTAHHDALRFLAFESRTLRELHHPNIVQYLGCESSAQALSVYVELVYPLSLTSSTTPPADFWNTCPEGLLRRY